jgi:site-specific DNA-methyltransferase (adenine-specific)
MPVSEIYNEDCYETLKRLEDKSIDMILQDAPFGVTQNEWDIKPDLNKMWPEWLRVAKDNAAFLFFATQRFASELVASNPKHFRYDLIWHKPSGTGHLNANRMPLRNHELILVFYRSLPTYNPQKTTGHVRKVATAKHKRNCKVTTNYGAHELRGYDSTERHPTSVLSFAVEPNPFHPTQKPVELKRYLIRTYSNENDTVFDGYVGSGTTPAAAYIENRNFKGSENKDEYYQYSTQRLETLKDKITFFNLHT